MMKTIRWGIVGMGRFGEIHADAIRSTRGSELSAICNRNPEKLRQAAVKHPDSRTFEDYHDLIKADDIDVVSITTHWQQHFEIAKNALLNGKHVFLEKPMAATSQQCRELVEIADQSAGHLMVGHVCRFDPRVSLARTAIKEGRIGRIVSMHAKRNLPTAPGHVRLDKISPLMGDGIHDADLMMCFMKRLPSRVYAKNIRSGNFEYPDLGWAMLEFGDQAVGVIETVWCLPQTTPTVIDAKMEVIGTEGKLTIDCSQTGFQIMNNNGNKMSDTIYWPEQYGRRVGALPQELAYFADCVRANIEPTVLTPQDAANAVTVMELAERSAATAIPIDVTHAAIND